MSTHDYIGLSETSSRERSSEKILSSSSTPSIEDKTSTDTRLNLKETELRLGLPGSQSPDRKLSLFGKHLESNDKSPLKNFVSGAKRGFSDAIDGPNGNGKWGFPMNGISDVDLAKAPVLASPRAVPAMKEVAAVPLSPKPIQDKKNPVPPASKAQVVGWPPIRSFRKNTMASNSAKNAASCHYVKVSMDGAPYLRKVDLKTYKNYVELSSALEKMFSCFTIGQCSSSGFPLRDGLSRLMDLLHGSEYVLTYEDKDGDWLLVGDVPWEMFTESCKRLRIMNGSEAIGLVQVDKEQMQKNTNVSSSELIVC
ncbi:hypothetical protein V6N13_063235 [Hibiscus sabdariffa]|uniref:Uncharacterized protein n=2 Tax=Hibiscus sabdariffa TaxID=183260 RepID=A0ABR2C4K1_9ROSI